MGTDKKSAKRSLWGDAMLALVACLGFASQASAETRNQLPAALISLASYDDADRPEAAARQAGELIAADTRAEPVRQPLYVRYRSIKFLNFQREVEVLNEDLVFRVQSPGGRKSFMMVELKF